MSKNIYLLILVLFLGSSLVAQKGRDQLNLALEASLPIFQNDSGFGGFIKGMYGVGRSAQLSFMTGVSAFKSKNSVEQTTTVTRLIPVLVGYKQNFHKFYIEPQGGFGELGGKISIAGDYARPSVGEFFWAVGAGYDHKRLTAGIRFQQAYGAGSSSAGIWYNKDFHYTGIHLGYKLF